MIRNFAALVAVGALAAAPAIAQQPSPTAATALAGASSTVKIDEGTELPLRLEEALSSKSAQQGDRFAVVLAEDVKLPSGTVLHAGYKGVGEVLDAEKNGMLGKTGKLAIRVNYLKVGDQRIKVRATRDVQGEHNTAVQVGALVLLWPAMPFIKGNSTQIKKGTMLTGFVNDDTVLSLPLPPPPSDQ